jgi:multiple sugar transport system permease protein
MLRRKLETNQALVAIQPKVLDPTAAIRRRKLRDIVEAYLFLTPNILGFLVFILFPLVAAFAISLFNWSLLTPPTFIGLGNYIRLLTQDPVFRRVLLNTLYFVFGYVPLNIVISLGLALWLSGRIRAKNLFRIIFFFPVMTPGVAVSLVWLLMYDQSGVINWFLALIHIHGPNWVGSSVWAMPAVILMSLWYGFGYNMLVFAAGLQSIPSHFYEAAAIDGATRLRQFWNITIPLLSPSIFFALVMTLITSFQVFDQVFILTAGGPGASTTTLVLYTYQNGFSYFRMGYAASVSSILFMLIMVVTIGQFFLQQRWVHYEV